MPGPLVRGLHGRRLIGFLSQFSQLRLAVIGMAGLACLLAGIAVDSQSAIGVILVSLGTGVLASIVVAAVALEKEDFAQTVLGLGVQEVFSNRELAFDDDFWNSLVQNATKRFAVLGVANHGYLRNEVVRAQTEKAVVDAVERGVNVELLWLNPESDLATFREESEEKRGTRDDTVASIDFFWSLREGLGDDAQARLKLAEHEAMPTCGITWMDDLVIVSHYLAQKLNLGSPGLVLGPSLSLADRLVNLIRRSDRSHPKITAAYMANYHEIAASCLPLTAERVAHLRGKRGTWGPESAARKSEADLRTQGDVASESQEDGE